MTDMVRSFSELPAERQASAGGKGGALARLYQAGYPVPDGFIILPSAFAGDKLKPEAWAQVRAHLARMRGADGSISFAVRSSALSEDSSQASFAGEFETVLDVHTDEMIRAAIHTVRQSGESERVQAYSEAKGIDLAQDMAVVVTATTNVGWTPLFPRAAAIVTDVGAQLSHAAIVAREIGIPAVVGCGNATMRLHSGDRVRVDGGHGIVEILEPRSNK